MKPAVLNTQVMAALQLRAEGSVPAGQERAEAQALLSALVTSCQADTWETLKAESWHFKSKTPDLEEGRSYLLGKSPPSRSELREAQAIHRVGEKWDQMSK